MNTINKKKILIFSLVYYPRFIGGAEVAVKEITDRLGEEFDFDMITLRKSAPRFERVGKVNVYRVGFGWRAGDNALLNRFKIYKYFFPFFAFFKALSLHRKNNYDAAWSIMANYAGFAALFFKLANPQVPSILTLQEGDPFDYIKSRVGIFYPLFKRIFTKADFITTISTYLADWAKEMGAKGNVVVVPNGVDINKFKVESIKLKVSEREKLRKEFGIAEDDTVLVTTSRLVEKNAVGDIISSLTFLPDNVKLLVIGTGALERSLKLKVESLKLAERVKFLGFVAHGELPKYLWASDIFIRPSLSEGMGNSFIEAMAAGIPVIATPVGGILDFLKDGETGLFCEVGNPRSIAQKVVKLIKDAESRDYIVRTAEQMVTEKYDWNLISEQMRTEIFFKVKSLAFDGGMKILIATGIYPPDIGGPAQYAKNLESVWKNQGYSVTVKFFGFERNLPSGIRHLWYFFKILPGVFRSDRIFILDTLSAAAPTFFAARIFGKPITIRTGGDFLWESYVERTNDLVLFKNFYKTSVNKFSIKEKFIFKLTKFLLQHTDNLIFSTKWQRDIFIEAYSLNSKKLCVIENYYGPKEESFDPIRKNFVSGTRKLRWKNLNRLEEAVSIAREGNDSIIFDNENLPFEAFMEKISHSYAVILASLGDISPNLILDAIRYNKPFIVTCETGLHERIKDCAIFVDPENVGEIAEKILWLADPNNYELQKRKVEAFSFKHSWEDIAREFLESSKIQNKF